MGWISAKSFLPRGIYGRAALILIFPVVTLQLGVSVVFIQRHFDRVTRQMVEIVEPQIAHILKEINASQDAETATARVSKISADLRLEVVVNPDPGAAEGDQREFTDLTGRVLINQMRSGIPSITSVNLLKNDGNSVEIKAATDVGEAVITLGRRTLSPSNPHQLLVLMVVFGFLTTLIAFMFLRNQIRPVKRLARASEAFGKGQNIELAVSGATEVRSAANAFIDMRSRIIRQIEQRTLMLSSISHDLKTPLTRLRIGLEFLEKTPETTALIADVEEMNSMIDEILEYARSEKLEEFRQTDLVPFVTEIVDQQRKTGHAVELRMAPPVKGLAVSLREQSVRRSLENLLGNAVRHAEVVRLSVDAQGDLLTFVVEDNGPGIPDGQTEAALRPFTRLDTARNLDAHVGVGLGLAIAKDIAGSHRGELTLGASADLGGLRAEFALRTSDSAPDEAAT